MQFSIGRKSVKREKIPFKKDMFLNTEIMQKIKDPYYQLSIDAGCAMEVLVNDVIVSEWKGKDTAGTAGYFMNMPINQVLLESGTYKVIGKMYPDYGLTTLRQENGLKIDFYVASIDNPKAFAGFSSRSQPP